MAFRLTSDGAMKGNKLNSFLASSSNYLLIFFDGPRKITPKILNVYNNCN